MRKKIITTIFLLSLFQKLRTIPSLRKLNWSTKNTTSIFFIVTLCPLYLMHLTRLPVKNCIKAVFSVKVLCPRRCCEQIFPRNWIWQTHLKMEIYFVGDRPAQVIYAVPHSERFHPNNFTFSEKNLLNSWIAAAQSSLLLICTKSHSSFSWAWLRNSISSQPLSQSDNF